MTEYRIAIAGLGTVGGEVAAQLATHADHLESRAGRKLKLVAISARDQNKKRAFPITGLNWYADPVKLAQTDVDAVVELMGGSDGPALDLATATLSAGKTLITANKALLAKHGAMLAALAEQHNATLYFEAAVAGGIPVIKTLREALAGNTITAVSGILNGTCNYILSTMRETGRSFADILADAQKLGYAEADPSFDVDGTDTGHKLAILASLAFGMPADLTSMQIDGIRNISPVDIEFADELGYRIKLLGVARRTDKGVMQRVGPHMVPLASTLAHVDGVTNAVFVHGSAVGDLTLTGRGAGGAPTASAVLGDIIDAASARRSPAFGLTTAQLKAHPAMQPQDCEGAYYVRLMVQDKPGVLADLAGVTRDSAISIKSLLQKGQSGDSAVPVIVITHATHEKAMAQALSAFTKLPSVTQPPTVIRILPQN